MSKIFVNDKECEAPEGTVLLEALNNLGFDVPFFCFHNKLSIAANCRMCLVELEGRPKLEPSCHLKVQEGMKVYTNSDKVLEARRSVMELILVNHPIDCPVCDQAGECFLQDYYMEHARHTSRVPEESKSHFEKAVRLGDMVYLDRERCIQCTRCVRFMDEIAKDPQLEMIGRGDHSYIDVAPGTKLDNPYSANVVDLCPVGALTLADFRFKMRVWWLDGVDSICTGCSHGCNIDLHYNRDRVYRYKPRENNDVNECWLCDEGRLSYKEINDKYPWKCRVNGAETSFAEAVEKSVNYLSPYLPKEVESKVLLAVSAQQSNEEVYLAGKIFKELFGLDKALVIGKPAGTGDDFLRDVDKNPNRRGVELTLKGLGYKLISIDDAEKEIGENKIETVFCLGSHIESNNDALKLLAAQTTIILTPFETHLTENATVVIPIGSFAESEGSFVNSQNRIQLFHRAFAPRGDGMDGWKMLLHLAENLGMTLSYRSAAQIFAELAVRVNGFNELTYSKIGKSGTVIS